MNPARAGPLVGFLLVCAATAGNPAPADSLWPRLPTAELVVSAAPFVPSMSTVRLSVPAARANEADWLQPIDAVPWYLADSAWLFPVSYLEVGIGVRYAWLEGRRLLLESGIATALCLQTLEGTLSVPLVLEGLARYALSRMVCLQSELELLVCGQGFAASGGLGVRWRPLRFGLLLGAAAGYGWAAVWDLTPGGGAVQLALSAGYIL